MTKKTHYENECFDTFIGISGWIFGCIEGIMVGIFIILSEKKEDDDLINEIEIFVHQMEKGYSTGKNDTKTVGKFV